MYLGLDIGSSSSKAVLLGENQESLAAQVVNLGTGTKGVGQVLEAVYRQAGIGPEEVRYTVVTGYGRMTYQGADRQITEISCHAKGVFHLSSSARTIVDVGGQDTKVIRLGQDGSVENFVMNDKCAAGTGRFLEVMARVLDCPIASLSQLAQQGEEVVPISNLCTVFAESEVISRRCVPGQCGGGCHRIHCHTDHRDGWACRGGAAGGYDGRRRTEWRFGGGLKQKFGASRLHFGQSSGDGGLGCGSFCLGKRPKTA